MDVKTLVATNNERKKQLQADNLAYYDELLVYIRLASLKDEQAKEEVLLELLEHLIEAQQNGKVAEEVFGKSPQQLADEIIESLPAVKKVSIIPFMLETVLLLVGVYIASTGFFNLLLDEAFQMYVGSALVGVAALVGGFFILLPILLKQLRQTSFTQSKKPYIFATIAFTVYVFTVAVIINFVPSFGQHFTVTPMMMILTGMAFLAAYIAMKFFNK